MLTPGGPRRVLTRTVAFLWGLQSAFLNPALALLLVSLFGASTGQVAIVLAIYNGACLLTSWAIPRAADRRESYVALMLGCAVFTVALSVSLLIAGDLTVAVVGLVLLGAPAAVAMPLLFGYVRYCGATPADVVRTRAMFSIAWVAGPPMATIVIAALGGHALVAGIGCIGAVNLLVISRLPRSRPAEQPRPESEVEEGTSRPRSAPSALVLLFSSFAGLQAANTASVAMTTLFATKTLGLSPLWGGAALAVAAALEVPTLYLLGRYADRISEVPVLAVACVAGILFYLGVCVTHNGYQLIALEVLNALFYGAVAGLGLTLFQAMIPGPGAAAGLMSNALRVGALVAGPLVGVGYLLGGGLRLSYAGCAVLTALALCLVLLCRRASVRGIGRVTDRPGARRRPSG